MPKMNALDESAQQVDASAEGEVAAVRSAIGEAAVSMPDASVINQAAAALARGEAVVFPTDTVFGLAVSPQAVGAPHILYDIKGRDEGKPIAWLVGGAEDLETYGRNVPSAAISAARAFWPGALTLIVNASDRVPQAFQSAAGTIGLRMPNSETALSLLHRVGCPLATTSANISGEPAPRTQGEISPQLLARVGALVPGAAISGVASTIVDCTGQIPVILREGEISSADLEGLL